MMNLKFLTTTVLAAAFAISCSSGPKKEDNTAETAEPTGADYKTEGSNHAAKDTSGVSKNEGLNNGAESHTIPNGTGTEPKKIDTGEKRGKWPTQGDPFS
jgi:hypothetical protein